MFTNLTKPRVPGLARALRSWPSTSQVRSEGVEAEAAAPGWVKREKKQDARREPALDRVSVLGLSAHVAVQIGPLSCVSSLVLR